MADRFIIRSVLIVAIVLSLILMFFLFIWLGTDLFIKNTDINELVVISGDQPAIISNDENSLECSSEEIQEDDHSDLNTQEANKSYSDHSDSANRRLLLTVTDGDYLLALVNKETTLKSDYEPSDLVRIPANIGLKDDLYIRVEALKHLKDLFSSAQEDGVDLKVISAYRSYQVQKDLFRNYAAKHGEENANRFSARAGQSEHQLGTTVDFGGTAFDFKPEYGNTKQGRWLAENAYRYGFVMSYPRDMEHITGYIYEPWHFRFIGVDVAYELMVSGKTLVEFLRTIPQIYD